MSRESIKAGDLCRKHLFGWVNLGESQIIPIEIIHNFDSVILVNSIGLTLTVSTDQIVTARVNTVTS